MVKRNQIEAILKMNGVEPTSPDEIIRSVLLSARYSENEVDTALMVLRENIKTNKTRVDGLHKVFRTDEGLKPDEIAQLLGIEVNVSERIEYDDEKDGSDFTFTKSQKITILVIAFTVTIVGFMMYMYIFKIGYFYQSLSTF